MSTTRELLRQLFKQVQEERCNRCRNGWEHHDPRCPNDELARRIREALSFREEHSLESFKRKVCAACGYSDKETHADGTWVCHRCGEGDEP
jgi:hypothetical protein